MTNEELSLLIRSGHREYYAELWKNTAKLFTLKALSFYNSNKQRCIKYGIELDDLVQSCFPALVLAVDAYAPESGFVFNSYLNFHVKNIFAEMTGLKGKQTPPTDISLNEVLIDGETERGELIPDEAAFAQFERVDYDITLSQLKAVLESIMDELPPIEAQVIRERFYNQNTLKDVAEHLSVTPYTVRATERKAVNHMRRSRRRRELEPFRDELIGCIAYHGTGLTAFRQRNASSVELAFEKAERLTVTDLPGEGGLKKV